MEKVLVFIDGGFISKVSYNLGERSHLKYDLVRFAKRLTGKEELIFSKLFYYNAPPYQSEIPTREQKERKEKYDKFISKLKISGGDEITVREGRLQRTKNEKGEFMFKQKGVDTHLIMDLMTIPVVYPKIKKIILVASDSDFVPIVNRLKQFEIEVMLYTYFDRERNSKFSTSNFLLKSVKKWKQLSKGDFDDCALI